MIILVDESSLAGGLTPGLVSALRASIIRTRVGQHRLLISPRAYDLLKEANPTADYLADLAVIRSGWVEGQAIARTTTRALIVTTDDQMRGAKVDNLYHVHADDLERDGVLEPPCYVTENMNVDGALLRAYIAVALDLTKEEFRSAWSAQPQHGGGDTISAYVHRYAAEPCPVALIVDRDTDSLVEPTRRSTAGNCASALVERRIFADHAQAFSGGYSGARSNIAFRVIEARSIENLVFPPIMELFFSYVASGQSDDSKRVKIKQHFSRYPDVDGEESRWLFFRFRGGGGLGGPIFDSDCIRRLMDWVGENRANEELFRQAARDALAVPAFGQAVRNAVKDLWSLGQRTTKLA